MSIESRLAFLVSTRDFWDLSMIDDLIGLSPELEEVVDKLVCASRLLGKLVSTSSGPSAVFMVCYLIIINY